VPMAPKSPCMLAPRGELSGGALQLNSRKKQLFMALARSGGLYRNLRWHASSEHEAADIRARLGTRVPIRIAANLPAMAQEAPPSHPRQPGEPLRICFLSRISPMKNLDFALSIIGELDIPVRFDISGSVSDAESWSRCQALMASLPANIEARHGGSIEHAAVRARLAEYDLFFLPTRGENFGH